MTWDQFLDGLPGLTREIGLEDRAVLRHFLTHPSMLAVLATVMFERSKLASELISTDLKFMENSDKALYVVGRTQGIATGIQRAVEVLFELLPGDEEETTTEEEDNG